ncbi:hypothetical protein SUDANB140_04699 [Streptomyces sp. enrichment culture]
MVISYFPGRGTVFEEAYYDGEANGKAAGLTQGMAKGLAEGLAEGMVKGMARGMAASIVRVLEARGLTVSHEVQARVVGCTDLARLDFWLGRVGTVEQAEGLFAMRPGEPPEKPALE